MDYKSWYEDELYLIERVDSVIQRKCFAFSQEKRKDVAKAMCNDIQVWRDIKKELLKAAKYLREKSIEAGEQ